MSFLRRFFAKENANASMRPLYEAIVQEGREVHWYEQGAVPDTLDGRFDMIAAILSLVLIKLEDAEDEGQQSAWLMEHFVTDMDGQLRQIGIGDMVVGKHVKKLMGAMGGRLTAYREALLGDADFKQAIVRNIFRSEGPDEKSLDFVASRLQSRFEEIQKASLTDILVGRLPEAG